MQPFEENQRVEDVFICANKTVREDKNGNTFLVLQLMNARGKLGAVMWRVDESVAQSFDQGQVVRVSGTVKKSSYRNQLEIELDSIVPVPEDEADPAALQPVSPRDVDVMRTEFREIRGDISNLHLQALLDEIFTAETLDAFCQAPAAKGMHHNYIHGLLEHSISVCRVAGAIARQYQDVDVDLLLTAAILHDIGKTVEFRYVTAIDYSDRGRLLGHIVIGEKIIADAIARLDSFPDELELQLLHLVLSHHGEKEYGSPVRPKTLEAFILNHADDVDAKANIFERHRSQTDAPWSEYHRLLDRFLYLKKAEG